MNVYLVEAGGLYDTTRVQELWIDQDEAANRAKALEAEYDWAFAQDLVVQDAE